MNVTINVMTDSLDCYLNCGPGAPVTFGDERSKTFAEPHVIDSKIMKRLLIPSLLVLVAIAVSAQNRMTYSVVSPDNGHVALGLAIRKLNVSGTFMQAPAHPDDETNALFALFTHGMGLRSVDVQNNRGEGGQNEIGPELFRDIGVLRTSELVSAHRIDGAEQYFTRAIDYGYSFDPEEVINKWGRDAIIGDYVRLIRELRPDVLVTMNIQGRGGDRAHEATTVLAREAYRAAGNPAMYPEQLREGLRPWQPRKLYFNAGAGVIGAGGRGGRGGAGGPGAVQAPAPAPLRRAKVTRVNTAMYDELLGRTYAEIGADAHSNHKCQGTSGLPALPGFATGRGGGGGGGQYTLDRFDDPGPDAEGRGVAVRRHRHHARRRRAVCRRRIRPKRSTTGLAAVVDQARAGEEGVRRRRRRGNRRADRSGSDCAARAARPARCDAAERRRALRDRLPAADQGARLRGRGARGARRDVRRRCRRRARRSRGQPVSLSLLAVNRGGADVSVSDVTIAGFDPSTAQGRQRLRARRARSRRTRSTRAARRRRCRTTAKLTTPYFTDDYWKNPSKPAINNFEPGVPFGVPFAPTPFRVTFHVQAGSADVTKELPIQYRYVKDIYNGDKRMELNVVPAFSVRVTPPLEVIPAPAAGAAAPVEREIHVAVTNGTKGAAERQRRRSKLPAGWSVTPPSVPIAFAHEDESLSARFQVIAPAQVKAGRVHARAPS